MASILDRYGIKEVADCVFYEINETDGTAGAPVLYLDSLKVSTLEQTAETVYAQGGKGNSRLIGWDFGKEITLNLEDALFSPKSMAIMFGNGKVDQGETKAIKKTVMFTATSSGEPTAAGAPSDWTDAQGNVHQITGGSCYSATSSSAVTSCTSGEKYFYTFDVSTTNYSEIVVGPDTFPGTYYITGDTYARSETTGKDEYFQFVVPKGKITSENTITMEADGDPSVFNMTVDVLRAKEKDQNVMIKLIKYTV